MSKERKGEQVNQLAEKLSRSSIILATNYRGLSVAEMTELRRQLRRQGAEYRVVKNTLTSLAAEKVGKRDLCAWLKGPTALALGSGDAVALAKALIDYQRSTKTPLTIKGGMLDGQVLSAAEIVTIASLPSREVLIIKLIGTVYGPIYGLVYVLSAELRGLLGVLQARIRQLEGG